MTPRKRRTRRALWNPPATRVGGPQYMTLGNWQSRCGVSERRKPRFHESMEATLLESEEGRPVQDGQKAGASLRLQGRLESEPSSSPRIIPGAFLLPWFPGRHWNRYDFIRGRVLLGGSSSEISRSTRNSSCNRRIFILHLDKSIVQLSTPAARLGFAFRGDRLGWGPFEDPFDV